MAAKEYGFSRACFAVRVMDIFTDATGNQLANFIAGAIGYYDIKSIGRDLEEKNLSILIGGDNILKELYSCIFELLGNNKNKIKLIDDYMVENAGVIGTIRVVEYLP